MKENARRACELILGILFIAAALWGYLPDPSHMGEYCFLSSLLTGGIFIASFIRTAAGKQRFPVWLYFDCMITVLPILIATAAMGLNLEGAFWFIHIIDPVLLFTYWCLFCSHTSMRHALVFTDLVFPACYLLLAFILWQATGNCPFPATMLFVRRPFGDVILGVVLVLAVFTLLGFLLHFINRGIHGKIAKGRTTKG